MEYIVMSRHAVDTGKEVVEPLQTFSDEDVDEDVLKQLIESGQVAEAEEQKSSRGKKTTNGGE